MHLRYKRLNISKVKKQKKKKLIKKPTPFQYSKLSNNSRMPKIRAIVKSKKPKYRDLKIIFLILNCKKNDYRRKKQTWLKTLPSNFQFFHIQGDPDLPVLYKIDKKNNLITLHCDDGYLGIPYKIMAAIKVINNNFEYDYIFKTDDDIIWDNFLYLKILNENLAENPVHYGGAELATIIKKEECYCHKFHDLNLEEFDLEPASYYSGNFYFLNKNLINILINTSDIENKKIEDHAMGMYITKISKKFKNLKMKTLRMGKELPYRYNYNGMGFYFNLKLKRIIDYTKLSFCIFNNKRLLDNIELFEKSEKPSCFFLHNSFRKNISRTFCNKIIDNFSHIENNDWWDIIYFVSKKDNTKTTPNKEERLMGIKNLYKEDFSKIENPSCDFILSRSGIKTMKNYLLNNIFETEMSKLRIFVAQPLF